MTCPFAKFASILPLAPNAKLSTSYHAHHPTPSSSSSKAPLTISDALRLGTAASHRAVEKSRGVSLLLSSLTGSPSELNFDRVDYVRFQIMLACVYIALEASLVRSRHEAGLQGLWGDAGLMEALARSESLLDDIQAHLGTIQLHSGATLADLADSAREEHLLSSAQADMVQQDVENPTVRKQLLHLVQTAFPHAAQLFPSTQEQLTGDHIDLLHPAEAHSTLVYVETLLHLRTPTLLLAHAYTRYLGDLSGGQHIVRKVSKRFPTTTPTTGFKFYSFDPNTPLKTRFKNAMQTTFTGPNETNQVAQLVQEANRAFELNTALFESLLPPDLRMTDEERGNTVHITQVSMSSKARGGRERLVKGLVVAGTAVVMAHMLVRVGAGFIAARSSTSDVHF